MESVQQIGQVPEEEEQRLRCSGWWTRLVVPLGHQLATVPGKGPEAELFSIHFSSLGSCHLKSFEDNALILVSKTSIQVGL
jgi:hypothetical protein